MIVQPPPIYKPTPPAKYDATKPILYVLGFLALCAVIGAVGMLIMPKKGSDYVPPPPPTEVVSTLPSASSSTTTLASPSSTSSTSTSSSSTSVDDAHPEFTNHEQMMVWLDRNSTPCPKWETHEQGLIKGATCMDDKEIVVYGSELYLSTLRGNIKDYEPKLVGRKYVDGGKWWIIATDMTLLEKASKATDKPIDTFK